VLDISGKVIGVRQLCMLFRTLVLGSYACCFSLIGSSHVCIVLVFLDIPAVEALRT
jgi:hypothetical protein